MEGRPHDHPTALATSHKIRYEVLIRYGIDTHDVGADAPYLESDIQTITAENSRLDALEEKRKAAAEHEKAMQSIAAARAQELRAKPQYRYLNWSGTRCPSNTSPTPELAHALQRAHNAKTPKATAATEAEITERMFLIGKDGINVPNIDQLRKETTATMNGAEDYHFKDPKFVNAAKEMPDAKLLAEGGFTAPSGHQRSSGMNGPRKSSSPALKALAVKSKAASQATTADL